MGNLEFLKEKLMKIQYKIKDLQYKEKMIRQYIESDRKSIIHLYKSIKKIKTQNIKINN